MIIIEGNENNENEVTGKFVIKPHLAYIFTKYIYGDINGNIDLEHLKRRWMTDRTIVSESTIDLKAMENEEIEINRKENIQRQAWILAKKKYNKNEKDGGISVKQFNRVMIELRERDHHLVTIRREFNRRRNNLMNAKQNAIKRLRQLRIQLENL